MGFMDTVECYETDFYLVDGPHGTALIPGGVVDIAPADRGQTFTRDDGARFRRVATAVAPYYSGKEIWEIEVSHGWIARYTALGYLDSTDWVHGATEQEAVDALKAIYGND